MVAGVDCNFCLSRSAKIVIFIELGNIEKKGHRVFLPMSNHESPSAKCLCRNYADSTAGILLYQFLVNRIDKHLLEPVVILSRPLRCISSGDIWRIREPCPKWRHPSAGHPCILRTVELAQDTRWSVSENICKTCRQCERLVVPPLDELGILFLFIWKSAHNELILCLWSKGNNGVCDTKIAHNIYQQSKWANGVLMLY